MSDQQDIKNLWGGHPKALATLRADGISASLPPIAFRDK